MRARKLYTPEVAASEVAKREEQMRDVDRRLEVAVMALYEIAKSTEDDEGGKWPTADAQHAKVTLHKLKCWPVFSQNMLKK